MPKIGWKFFGGIVWKRWDQKRLFFIDYLIAKKTDFLVSYDVLSSSYVV